MVERDQQVLRPDGPVPGDLAARVRRADDRSPGEPAARGQHAHHVAPVVAARDRVGAGHARLVHPRRPAELAHDQDHRRVEQPAVVEVLDQAADRGVEDRQAPTSSRFSRLEWIVPAAEGQGHEPHARLDQPAGQQRALAPLVAAVAVAEPRVFLADVEGRRGPRRRGPS